MFGRKTEGKEVAAATAVLEQYAKIEETIGAEVVALPIQELLEAGRELRDAEVSEALGEQPATPVAKAKKRLEAARGGIDTAVRRLQGLRGRLLTTVAAMPSAYNALAPTIPAHNEQVRASFAAEWKAACEAFGKILGRRRAIEEAIGERMDLQDPSPIATEIEPEVIRPHQRLAGLRKCIEKAVEAEPPRLPSRGAPVEIGPYQVYVLTSASRGLPAGALVVRDSLPDGVLAGLVGLSMARPWVDPKESAAKNTARAAKLALDDAERARQAERIEADAKQRAAERKAYNKAHGIEEYDGPTGGACVPRVSMPGNPVVRSSYMAEYLSDK